VRRAIFLLALLASGCDDDGGGGAPDADVRAVGDARVPPPDTGPVDALVVWDTLPPDAAPPAPDAGCVPPGPGAVLGQVCAPNGRIWLVGAAVTVEWRDACTGEARSASTVTDGDGVFRLDGLPAGSHLLRIERGSFRGERVVTVRAGAEIDLSAGDRKTCLSAEATRLAVVGGRYDRVQELLVDLGLREFDLFDGVEDVAGTEAFLADAGRLADYDVLFLNCGIRKDAFARYDELVANLRAFVAGGGSVYVSDYSFFFFEDAFPEALEFHGDDADWQGEARMGRAPQHVRARIVSEELRAFMGADAVDVEFPENAEVRTAHWVVAESAAPGVTVLLEGDVQLCVGPRSCAPGGSVERAPLLVSYEPEGASGVVVFTSFHQEVNLSAEIERVLFYLVFML
jgi:hypothetical protein